MSDMNSVTAVSIVGKPQTQDRFYELSSGSFIWKDSLEAELEKLTSVQLKDASLWKLLVSLFKNPGVDDADHGWRCEYWGKMMRGACFTFRVTGDRQLYSVIKDTIEDMLSAMDSLGRFSTYSVKEEFHGWDIWGRKYIMLGFEYFFGICEDNGLKNRIVSALKAHADYMISKLGDEKDGKICIASATDHWDGLNSCSLLEPVVFLYNLTGEERYLTFAEYILSFGGTLHKNLFELAAEDNLSVSKYHVTKAYEMISCFEGLAEYNRIKPSEKHTAALKRFARRVLKEESTVIGCLGCNYESFDFAAAEQFNESHTGIMQETCVTVTWMKFLWQMFRLTGEAEYMDAFEVSAYNAMSAALKTTVDPKANGGIPLPIHSYNPLRWDVRTAEIGGRKNINNDSVYGCCVCISSCGFALEGIAAVCKDKNDNICFNLYRNGTVYTPKAAFTVKTDYPLSGKVTFTVMKHRGDFSVMLRIPSWADNAVINRGNTEIKAAAGSYAVLSGPWRDGDSFTLELQMPVRLLKPSDFVPGTAVNDRFALARGPVVLAVDGTSETEPVFSQADIDTLLKAQPKFSSDIPCREALPLSVVDYASAGQVEGHRLSCWMKKN